MTVRLYGRAQGNSSHARVTTGFNRVLREEGLLSGYVGLDLGGISEEIQREQDPLACRGAVANYGIFTGALGFVEAMLQHASHRERLVMVAPNSDQLPPGLVREIARVATKILAPSAWAAEVLRKFFEQPVLVVPHGVDVALSPAEADAWRMHRIDAWARCEFNVQHWSTTERERKGTLELIKAWNSVVGEGILPDAARLELILDPLARLRLIERLADEDLSPVQVRIRDRVDLPSFAMAQVLASAHLIAQPSRGEAFGLVPLEALALGVPVLATACTGHSQYLAPGTAGSVVVFTHEPGPIDDLPGATAPTLHVDDLAQGLQEAYENWIELHDDAVRAAPAISERWTWERQLAPLMTMIKKGTA